MGLANTWCIAGFAWAALGDWCGPWGWSACLLVPFGIVEMSVGLYARGSENPRSIVRWLAVAQMLALAFGAVPSAVVGLVVRLRV